VYFATLCVNEITIGQTISNAGRPAEVGAGA
jgi:hypothetical protein